MTVNDIEAGRKDRKAATDIRYAVARCSLGMVLVATTDEGVCALLLGDRAEELVAELRGRFPASPVEADTAGLEPWLRQAAALVDHPIGTFDAPIAPRGTAFEQSVWQALREIPAGTTATYAGIAARLGRPGAARAVAGACAANPLAVAVPCHRVVRGDGSLAGYRWGVERKRALLVREGVR